MTNTNSAKFRARVRSLIEASLGPDLDVALLYGSRARGDATPDSGWDVLVMLRNDADWFRARAAMRRLAGKIAVDTNESVSVFPLR